MTDDRTVGQDTPGFFARNRMPRLLIGIVGSAILLAAYLFGIQSYRAGMSQVMPSQSPPATGVSVVIVPGSVSASDQTMSVQVLVYPAASLLDASGLLTQELEVRLQPAVSGQTLTYPAGESPAPQGAVLPVAGVVQEYPFDRYRLSTELQVHSLFADSYTLLPSTASLFFRVPGWSAQASTSAASDQGSAVSATIVRDGSTRSIAVLLLTLMVILAVIAILVTGASTRGRMKLELGVASWMTALLFALIPIRGFFPGSPPLGSWMDVLVFFWVELILMLAVAAVVTTILLRAADTRHHPEENR